MPRPRRAVPVADLTVRLKATVARRDLANAEIVALKKQIAAHPMTVAADKAKMTAALRARLPPALCAELLDAPDATYGPLTRLAWERTWEDDPSGNGRCIIWWGCRARFERTQCASVSGPKDELDDNDERACDVPDAAVFDDPEDITEVWPAMKARHPGDLAGALVALVLFAARQAPHKSTEDTLLTHVFGTEA